MNELNAAIAYFENAVRESDEIIADCSPDLQAELTEQKQHLAVALEAMRSAQPDNEPLTLVFGRGELGVGTAYKAPDGPSREINIRRLSVPLQIASDTGDKGKYVEELENLLVRMQFENAESAHVLERAVRVVLEGFGQPSDDPLTLEELREMDGEPVWIDGGRFWALVSVSGQIVYLTENSGETVYADKWMKHMGNIYRRPPERGEG